MAGRSIEFGRSEDFLPAIPSRTCPKGKNCSPGMISVNLCSFAMKSLREQYWNKLNSPACFSPNSITVLSCWGWKWELFIPGLWKATTERETLSHGCPVVSSFVGASHFSLGSFFRSPMRSWQHGPCQGPLPWLAYHHLGAPWGCISERSTGSETSDFSFVIGLRPFLSLPSPS